MIFYFSGTGSSYHVAKGLSEDLGMGLREMTAAARRLGTVDAKGEVTGFVFPVYFGGIPDAVRAFAGSVKIINAGRTFCLSVCSGDSGAACEAFAEASGLHIDAFYDLVAEDRTGISGISAKPDPEGRIAEISDEIKAGAGGDRRRHASGNAHPGDYEKARCTDRFSINGECVSCHLCEWVCPEKTLKFYISRPIWDNDRCSLCLRCVNSCPYHAIEYCGKRGNYPDGLTHEYVDAVKDYLFDRIHRKVPPLRRRRG